MVCTIPGKTVNKRTTGKKKMRMREIMGEMMGGRLEVGTVLQERETIR